VLNCLSNRSIETAPARTGIDSANSQAVTKSDQLNNGSQDQYRDGSIAHLIPITVDMKLIADNREDKPAI
jgi:hypothetical protein